MLDWASQVPKHYFLSRFIAIFKPYGQRPVIESYVSRKWLQVDEIDLSLLRVLTAKDALSAAELAEYLADIASNSTNISIAEVNRRLENLVSAGVLISQACEPPIWWSLESARRQTPFVDFVEITNQCPATCVMCRAANGFMERPRGIMRLSLFKRIIEMIGPRPHFKPLILHNVGEPLLHPKLLDMISIAQESDIPTEISTNAGLLTIEAYQNLCDAGIARIVIALDGTDVETLSAIRGRGSRPQEAFKNIEAILNYRSNQQSELPMLVLQMVRMQANAHQHRQFLERYGQLGLPGVSAFLKPVEAPAGSPLLMPDIRPPQFFCVAPWQTLGIYWDGTVVPCCYDLNASLRVGDVNYQTLTEIWEGQVIAELRERLKTDQCFPRELCSICHHRPDRYQRPNFGNIPDIPNDWH